MLRLLKTDDLQDLLRLRKAAGWNQTAADWLHVLRIEPGGCFGVEEDGRIQASAVCITYGSDLAWVGMVLTDPAYRGRGFARRLLDRTLEYAGNRPTRLDATDQGRPLYATIGFRDEYPVERWLRAPGLQEETPKLNPLRIDPAYDSEVFGADRSRVLEPWQGASIHGGYAQWRPGAISAHFGPCVTNSEVDTQSLVRAFLASNGIGPCSWDLFDHARAVAAGNGFQPARHLMRMVRNATPRRAPDARIWAIAGFEFG